ncbi:MAG: efflux RND transporter periplasmic adaptor subunit [Planctomycetes bacterium]|nr:efflux RND transporter periplasmic adaptor subunit [Planctomycetota bacterium]MCW8137614.1 efflux RND transporter periplasmic adaptor subunit [Planctomycetota bacterium]
MNIRSSLTGVAGKVLWALRVIVVRLRFIGLMVIVALLVASWDTILVRLQRLTKPAVAPDSVGLSEHEYYCPMHPNVIRAEPASCPICGMPLSKRKRGEPEALPPGVLARVQLAPNRVRLAGVATTLVTRRQLERVIDTVGTVDVDERRLARISARVKGRVDELFVDFTGIEVERGAPLAKVYSQDLFTSSRELLLAQKQGGPMLAAARQRLLLWGLSAEQIDAMVVAGEPAVHVTVPSPISGTVMSKSVVAGDYVEEGAPMYTVADLSVLWMIARVFEDEAPFVHLGQRVEIGASAYPGRAFEGFVSFIDPMIDPRTRTVGVRVDVPNGARLLRPGMYVRASLRTPIGPSGEVETATHPVVYRCCSACPEIEQTTPGDCPKCGMALTPVELSAGQSSSPGYACRCPMHPDRVFRAAGPGACGLCGAQLVPEAADTTEPPAPTTPSNGPSTVTLYECPGHPDMTLDHPGICTKCGTMELIPRDAPAAEARKILADAAAARGEAIPAPSADPATITLYECPGHPDMTLDQPGICTKCGTMELIPRAVPADEARKILADAAAARGVAPTAQAPNTSGPSADGPKTRTIYECPMHPEVTQDEPGTCAPCGGMKLIPREVPVDDDPNNPLVVPTDAVIDTGIRQVVYREAEEGVYDAVQVELGPRSGDFYPVISGLRLGDRVVTRGAFLVDAEARLSPAATSNYFGASNTPGSSSTDGAGLKDGGQ